MKRTIKRSEHSSYEISTEPAEPTTKKFDAIICSDLHLREDCPICRTDNYQVAQWGKVAFIKTLCEEHSCNLLCAGDLWDTWKPSPWLISQVLIHMPKLTICIPGQHDLQNHSLAELSRTGLNTLVQARRVNALDHGRSAVVERSSRCFGYAYGEDALVKPDLDATRHILLIHQLVCNKKQPWPDAGADEALKLLAKYKHYDLIVTGDNHQQFVVRANSGVLVNPGSMMRMDADQIDHEPAVFGWRAEDNSITRIPLPIKTGVVSREHLGKEKREDRDVRMEAYIVRAKKQYTTKLSFIKNLEQHFRKNKETAGVEKLTWKAVEGI